MNAVALPVAGAWSRQWEEDPIGDSDGADRTTLVLWVQTPSGVYIDLRLPPDSPGRSLDAAQAAGIVPRPGAIGATPTTTSNDPVAIKNRATLIQHIEILCRQKSFAGVLDYQVGDTTDGTALKQDSILAQLATERLASSDGGLGLCTCFWRRDLDYQPPSGGLDVGVCASEAPEASSTVLLRETGSDASYAEGWLRSPHTHQGPFMALELLEEWVESRISGLSGDTVSAAVPRSGYWVRAGDTFAYAIGRPTTVHAALALNCPEGCASIPTQCVGKSLFEAANHLVQDESQQLDLVRCYVAVAGQVVAQGEGELWEIQFSTNPELVGCALCSSTLGENALVCSSLRRVPSSCEELETSLLVDQCWSIEGTTALHSGLVEGAARRRWRLLELDGCRLPLACRGLKHP
jgi:hypothetical protein